MALSSTKRVKYGEIECWTQKIQRGVKGLADKMQKERGGVWSGRCLLCVCVWRNTCFSYPGPPWLLSDFLYLSHRLFFLARSYLLILITVNTGPLALTPLLASALTFQVGQCQLLARYDCTHHQKDLSRFQTMWTHPPFDFLSCYVLSIVSLTFHDQTSQRKVEGATLKPCGITNKACEFFFLLSTK